MKTIYQVLTYYYDYYKAEQSKVVQEFKTLKVARAFVQSKIEEEELHMLSEKRKYHDRMNNYRLNVIQTVDDFYNTDSITGNSLYPMTKDKRASIAKYEANYDRDSGSYDRGLFEIYYALLGKEFKQDNSSYIKKERSYAGFMNLGGQTIMR